MFSARLGHSLDRTLAPLAKLIPASPNALSITGFAVTLAAAVVLTFSPGGGAILIVAGGAFDLLDGVVARTHGKETRFGALLDSTLDRYADAALFISIAWLFFGLHDMSGLFFTIGALVGAFLTSYVRARAEGLGIGCNVGLMERPERIVLLTTACVTGWFFPIVVVLFVLGNITVVQRVVHVYRKSMAGV